MALLTKLYNISEIFEHTNLKMLILLAIVFFKYLKNSFIVS